jgi:transcriptional regulator with XRE-family HTH domain
MRLRESRGLSEAQLAELVGLERAYIPAVELGEIDLRWHTLMTFLRALGISLGDLAAELED